MALWPLSRVLIGGIQLHQESERRGLAPSCHVICVVHLQ
jgi:hypothetical protein